jgi:hypothetical protein
VGRLQQLVVPEPADGAALLVRAQDALAKATLVQALAHHGRDVLPSCGERRRVVEPPGDRGGDLVVDRHHERQCLRLILHDEHRPRGLVEAGDDAVPVEQRRLPLHRQPEADVVAVARVGSPIPVAEETALHEPVVVGPLAMLDRRGRW